MEEEKGGNEERMGSQRNHTQHAKRDGQGKRMEGAKLDRDKKAKTKMRETKGRRMDAGTWEVEKGQQCRKKD